MIEQVESMLGLHAASPWATFTFSLRERRRGIIHFLATYMRMGPFWRRVPWCCEGGAVGLLGYGFQSGLLGQGGGLVGGLPGELRLGAAEVAVGGGLQIGRASCRESARNSLVAR